MKKIFVFLTASLFFLSCLVSAEPQAQNQQLEETQFAIDAFDTVEISVYDHPDLSITSEVSEDGIVRMPLLEEVKIEDLTPKQAGAKIESLLEAGYLANPRVSVEIVKYAPFSIYGAVNEPGEYQLRGPYTLEDALVTAEGAKENANLEKVKVFRRYKRQKKEKFVVDAGREGEEFFLKPLDRIIVDIYGDIYVMGAVEGPGVYKLKRGDYTPKEAITFLAGGSKENANLSEVRILRETEEGVREHTVDISEFTTEEDFYLKEGDKIYVKTYQPLFVTGEVKVPGEYPFRKGMTAFDAVNTAGGFTEVASTNGVRIIRKTKGGQEKKIVVPVGYIMKTGNKEKDVQLKEGDTIVVPESWF